MAKKAQGVGFGELSLSIRSGHFAPVYLLMGEEPYYLDRITDLLEEKVVKESDKDFDCDIFYGAEADLHSVAMAAQQFPMMGEKRLVVLKEAQALTQAKTVLDRLESYVARPTSSTVFVVVYKGDNLNSTSKIVKAAEKSGAVVFRSDKLKEWELPRAAKAYCTEKKIAIDDKCCSLLADFVGNDLSRLFGEIDKLIVAGAQQTARIDAELIERNIGLSKEFNNFELVNSLSTRNYVKAMQIVDYFTRNPRQNPLVMTVALLFGYFSKLCIALSLTDRSDAALMNALQAKSPYALREVREGMGRYTFDQARRIVSELRSADCRSKGIQSLQNEHAILKELVFAIFAV